MSHLFATNCSFHHMNTKLDKVSLWWTCLKVSLMRNLICTVEYWTKMEQRDFWIVLAHRQSDKYHCFSDLPVLDKWICSGCGAIAAGCDRGTTMETKQSKNTAAISRHHLLITPSNFSIEIRYYALVFGIYLLVKFDHTRFVFIVIIYPFSRWFKQVPDWFCTLCSVNRGLAKLQRFIPSKTNRENQRNKHLKVSYHGRFQKW